MLQMVAALGGCQLPDWICLIHAFPRPSFGMKLLGGESNVTSVKRLYANYFHLSIVFGSHDGSLGNINLGNSEKEKMKNNTQVQFRCSTLVMSLLFTNRVCVSGSAHITIQTSQHEFLRLFTVRLCQSWPCS